MINLIRNLIKRSRVTNPGTDNKDVPISQVNYLGKTANSEMIYPYGMGALAPTDALCITLNVNGQEQNKVSIATLPKNRVKNLKPGEVFFGNTLANSIVFFQENGDLVMNINGNVVINAPTQLGGTGGLPIARVGDSVVGGVITTGSLIHTAT